MDLNAMEAKARDCMRVENATDEMLYVRLKPEEVLYLTSRVDDCGVYLSDLCGGESIPDTACFKQGWSCKRHTEEDRAILDGLEADPQ